VFGKWLAMPEYCFFTIRVFFLTFLHFSITINISFIFYITIIIFFITIQIKKNSKIQIFFTLYSNLLFFTNFKKITTHYFNIQITCQTNSKTYFSTFIGEKKCYFQYLFFQYQDYSCRSHKFYCGTYDLTGGKNEFKP